MKGKSKKSIIALMIAMVAVIAFAITANAYSTNWRQGSDGSWKYYENGSMVKNAWVHDGDEWYLIGEDGNMRSGVIKSLDRYYLLDPVQGTGTFGKLMKNGGVYQGITLVCDTSPDYEGALSTETVSALAMFDFANAPDISGTVHIEADAQQPAAQTGAPAVNGLYKESNGGYYYYFLTKEDGTLLVYVSDANAAMKSLYDSQPYVGNNSWSLSGDASMIVTKLNSDGTIWMNADPLFRTMVPVQGYQNAWDPASVGGTSNTGLTVQQNVGSIAEGGYDKFGVSLIAIEMLHNSREINDQKYGPVEVRGDFVTYQNGLVVGYEDYKDGRNISTPDPSIRSEIFKYYDHNLFDGDQALKKITSAGIPESAEDGYFVRFNSSRYIVVQSRERDYRVEWYVGTGNGDNDVHPVMFIKVYPRSNWNR